MICIKCRAPLEDGYLYCPRCGAGQTSRSQRRKSRGNGQGSVYQLPNRTWIAIRVLGYTADKEGKLHKQTVSKSGFRTKREAVNYLPKLNQQHRKKQTAPTLAAVYDKWLPTHRAGASTIGCYKAAWNYFRPLHYIQLNLIDIDDLQECLDDCPKGKRTRQNMKALCGLIYKYAIPRPQYQVQLNLAEYLIVSGEASDEKSALPLEAVSSLMQHVDDIDYASHIVCQCYLGFRPSELLALDAGDYDHQRRAFVGGAKTEAGRDRIVTVSPKIQPIIDRLLSDRISGPVFAASDGDRMNIKEYRAAFYAALDAAGIDNPVSETADGVKRHKYTPHSCRHTFATMMKNVSAPDKDKLRLIGHTSTEMLRHYQDVDIDSLRRITDAL
ncbi:MAG: tyrosine-type recombinase/integrase [Oscillospiraceae bacterium]|nr:tyrosine-type recombinase/integrase [Oscillospiraceae bacterium]